MSQIVAGLAGLTLAGGVAVAQVQAQAQPEQDASAQGRPASRRAVATITNTLPADGCAYLVTINGVNYAPDDSSRTAAAELMAGSSSLTAVVDYNLTGQTGVVQCGFGFNQTLPQVTFNIRRVIDSGQ